jgi:predicted dehydrogenase
MEYVLLVDMAIHHFDLIRCVTGRNIVNVHTQSYRPPWSWYKHHPAANVLMELESNVPFTYCGDWSAKGRCTSWNGDWRLQGSEGSLHMEGNRLQLAKCDRWQKNPTNMDVPFPELPKAGQSATLSHFAEAIRTGEPGPTNGADNLWSFGAVIAAVQSAREGRTVDVRELIR